jgi:hypothetical protein
MQKEHPDHHDAELVLRVYELRREPVMRQSRQELNGTFWPRSYEEVVMVTKPTHPLNAAYRQVGSYWEMVYGIVRHGIVHPEYFLESNGEGLFLYVRVAPFLGPYRAEISPAAFRNAEWVATETATGRRLFDVFTARVKAKLESR